MKRFGILLLLLGLAGCDLFDIPVGGTPEVDEVVPANGAENVAPGAAVKVYLDLPNGGISLTSIDDNSVTLTNADTGEQVAAVIRPENDIERLTLIPREELEFDTEYTFELTSTVEDEDGVAFRDYSSTFTTLPEGVPAVLSSDPADGTINVPVTLSRGTEEGITATIDLSGGGVDASTLGGNVTLTNLKTKELVPGNAGSSGGDDIITFQPSETLEEGTEYQFDVTSEVEAENGTPFIPYTSTFFTSGDRPIPPPSGDVALVRQPSANDNRHGSLAVLGSNLYASTIDGRILRYPIGGGGTLGEAELLTTIKGSSGEDRFVVGFTFDPAATPENPVAWISSTASANFQSGNPGDPANGVDEPWSGKITRLSGPNLQTAEDYVVGLPRSSKDHLTNSIAFNPAEPGVLYFIQGSNTAMGAPDEAWNFQPERVLTGAVLRLDTNLLGSTPLNVQTEDGGSYDPYASGAPLTIYATGIRNSYDLVWHSNGHLYVPGNGSNQGGIMPRYNPLPGTCENRPDDGYSGTMLADPSDLPNYVTDSRTDGWRINTDMNDYLFDIERDGYYGSPNPKRCEWILYGGGVGTPGGEDKIPGFPASIEPDPNYRGYAYNFGTQISPNGAVEYKGSAFPELQGNLLVAQYSTGDNVVAVAFDGSGNVSGEKVSITPSGGMADPIDIAEDPSTGYLYVSVYDASGRSPNGPAGIIMLRPE